MLNILPLISGIFVFLLGIFVVRKNAKSLIHKVFFCLAMSVSIWLFGTFMMFRSTTDNQAIFWDRFIYIGVVFVPALMYHFSVAWTKIKNQQSLVIVSYILGVIFLILSRTAYFVDDVFRYSWGVHTQARLFHHLFLIQFFFFLFLVLYNFYKYYNQSRTPSERNQARYVFLAFFILIIIGSTAFIPAYKISIYPFSYASGVLFTIILAYAIVTQRLMDIKFVLRNSFVYLASLSTIIIGIVGIQYVFNRFFINLATWAEVIVIILAVSSFPSIKNYYYRLANKYFFSSLYDSQQVIGDLSDKLRSTLEIQTIYKFISNTLKSSFHTTAVGILMFNEKKQEYSVAYNNGFKIGQHEKFASDKNLRNLFVKQNKSIVVEELNQDIYKKSGATIALMKKFGVEILTPLNIKNKNIGLIVLGAKESKDMYNNEDLRVLRIISAQVAIALQNALLYQESLEFGQKLKQEVDRATKELRQANTRLKQLDKAKTEFVSITSHQLRTPLSGIKGYLSMLLDGDFGTMAKEQQKVMADVFRNTERLVRLINVFLNISRIEAGRLKLEKTKFDLVEFIQESIKELQTDADKKHLKLEFIKPAGKIELTADRDKLQDVILNLIDNAIKYTAKGKVTINVKKMDNQAQVLVKDTGVGIAPPEAKELFNKFIRGRKIGQINTSGSGLGLFIAKKIVELHNGKIWVESEGQGKGSEFVFEIPIK